MILGIEVSRLARSCRDWHQLLEVCALFGKLICDLDGVYDPSQYNDRLVLGLKGTVSEVELHLIKHRMKSRGAWWDPQRARGCPVSPGQVSSSCLRHTRSVRATYPRFPLIGPSLGRRMEKP